MSERCAQSDQRSPARPARPASGETNGDETAVGAVSADVYSQQRQRRREVDWPVGKPWIWAVCRIDGHEAVGTGGLEQVGDQPRGDGLAAAVLLVLTA